MHLKIIVLEGETAQGSNLLENFTEPFYDPKALKEPAMLNGVKIFFTYTIIKKKPIEVRFWMLNMGSKSALLNPKEFKLNFRDSFGAILIFDISNYTSLNPLVNYIKIIRETSGDIPIMLVGNKFDLESSCQISTEEGELFVKNYGLTAYSEICVSTAKNIDKIFDEFINTIYEKYKKQITFT